MASQAAVFMDTIMGMKKALKRKAYDSDSDSSIDQLTNRGNKLRKKARYVHEGQLAPPSGPLVYRRSIEHAGWQRDIISQNPPLVDEEGYEVDSDDDDERTHAAAAAAAEYNPYADVRIEHLLTPLTAASDLPDHPTLSKPFTSKTLTELTRQAGDMVQKEKASLWRIKHLLTRLSGDHTWIPCEMVETENDIDLFGGDWERQRGQQSGKIGTANSEQRRSAGPSTIDVEIAEPAKEIDSAMETSNDVNPESIQGTDNLEELPIPFPIENTPAETDAVLQDSSAADPENFDPDKTLEQGDKDTTMEIATELPPDTSAGDAGTPVDGPDAIEGTDVEEDQGDIPVPRRMRTRAQAAASDNTGASRTRSITPESDNELLIHPYYLAPESSRPDRDFGLPQPEADETRRLLQLYIQKQEEVCRGAQRVYDGLLKADRYRHEVMKWCKAEAHVGANRDMSDGEDWYDKEEWGLTEDLKKGQDEEEEDAATTAKKTRTRRQ